MVHDWHVSTSSLWNVCIKSCSPKLSRLLFQLHAFATERIHEIVWGTNLHQFTQKQPHDKNFFCAYLFHSPVWKKMVSSNGWQMNRASGECGKLPPPGLGQGTHSSFTSTVSSSPTSQSTLEYKISDVTLKQGSETESCVSFYLRHFKGKKGGSFRRTIRSAFGIPLPIRYILAKSEEVWSA